ncbi:hypothetical protein OF83DRAFT_1159225 [Amylostereum chailletii]|nr:hypothetical protein OF83DRAFT_1159225 [Amylostereum chailletii]
MSHLHIILDHTNALLDDLAVRLRDGLYNPTSSEYFIMTRFFARLCLFLQMIDMPRAGQRDLIAMYASALGDYAVKRYALFLTSLELSADVAEWHLALTRTREHGLDVERVAVVTAERTIEHTFALPPARAQGAAPAHRHGQGRAAERGRDAAAAVDQVDGVRGGHVRDRARADERHPPVLPRSCATSLPGSSV